MKDRLQAGEHLSLEELTFIGAYSERRSERGWRSLGGGNVYENEAGLSEEGSATLHSLMAIESVDLNRERLEFLG